MDTTFLLPGTPLDTREHIKWFEHVITPKPILDPF